MAVTHGHGNPHWNREETLLALDLYHRLEGQIPSGDDERVRALSRTLRALPYHAAAARKPSFRNPDGVAFKLQNLRQVATGKGLTNSSKTDHAIWSEFGADPAKTRAAAEIVLRAAAALGDDDLASDEVEEFAEGKATALLHVKRERDPRVRRELLKKRRKLGRLKCDICDFVAVRVPLEHEDALFEAHHTVGLALSGERITRIGDLALLCANCHRLLHRMIARQKRWVSVAEARAALTPGAVALGVPTDPAAVAR